MQILYINGLSSSGLSGTADRLRKYLVDDEVLSPDLPVEPQEALKMVKKSVSDEMANVVESNKKIKPDLTKHK